MKYAQLKLAILLAVIITSCSKPITDLNPAENPISVKATDINVATLDKDAVEHYKDIAVLAEWYADHPVILQAELAKNKVTDYTDSTYNDFVAELSSLELTSDNGKSMSFFDLPEAERHDFLKDYVKLEAKFLDDKFKLTNHEAVDDNIESINASFDHLAQTAPFSDTFDFDAAAKKITSNHPYEELTDDVQHTLGSAPAAGLENEGSAPTFEQVFFKSLADLGILNFTLVTYNPLNHKNSPQEFIDKMRGEIRRGRVLVSLPGGYVTSSPLVFDNKGYDVGHVAIISKDASEIPAKINNDFTFTIGTNSDKGMHHEEISAAWTMNHSMSYLMQPVRKEFRYTPSDGPFGIKIPNWSLVTEDVDNNATYQRITGVLGRPYCHKPEMLTAKWAAPDRFICSSSAWWAIKEAHGIGIGNFYKPTIFPAGVYESSDMRIVAQSF
jgi:hypothetical protein